ncbi:MAG TPA: baseplate J/gp47 family protein [Candidatus Sumerlaeota bacterium]|nr:baseplate J/gp47 family protein [Candidatus Sumerlaeota bacterium]
MSDTPINYTAQDYESVRESLIGRLRQHFPEVNDLLESNQGVVMAEDFAWALAALYYSLNYRVEQHFVDTVQERRCALSLIKPLGYRPQAIIPATVTLQITAEQSLEDDVVIPAGFQAYCSGNGGRLVYETAESLTLTPGNPSGTVMSRQVETRVERFSSNGNARQGFLLSGYPIADILSVKVEGVEWQRVDGFWNSEPGSPHYRVDQLYQKAQITFGNGLQGAIPPADASIDVEYILSSGALGNVRAGVINSSVNQVAWDESGGRVRLSVTNSTAAYGGQDAETVARAIQNAMRYGRLYGRSVCMEDFVFAVESNVPAVRRAGVLTINEYPSLDENTVMVVAKMRDGSVFDNSIREAIQRAITSVYPRTITLDLIIGEAEEHETDFVIEWESEDGYSRGEVQARMETSLQDYFNLDNRLTAFGQPVYHSVLVRLLQGVEGVKYLHLLEPGLDVYPESPIQIPVMGSVEFTDANP